MTNPVLLDRQDVADWDDVTFAEILRPLLLDGYAIRCRTKADNPEQEPPVFKFDPATLNKAPEP